MAGDVVVLTNDGSGMEVVDVPEPMSMGGYKVESHWEVIDNKIYRIHAFVPIEETAEEAALNLSRLQFLSLPDNVAYESGLLPRIGSRFDLLRAGGRFGFPQSRVATRGSCASASRRMYPNQTGPRQLPHHFGPRSFPVRRGNEPEEGYAEWSSRSHERVFPGGQGPP